MNNDKNKEIWINKVHDTLKLGGRSEKTFINYKSAINRFLNYYDDSVIIKKICEDDLINYFKKEFLQKDFSAEYLNLNICAIKFLFSVCFKKEFNRKLLPNIKLKKKIPIILDKSIFIKIFNQENNLKHKCWLILSFCSGLRVEEVATIRIENILSNSHKLKVLGKGCKERYTILPDITIKYLRLYYKSNHLTATKGFLFKGSKEAECMNSKTIINYFTELKKKYNLDDNISFHTLRHSFATYYLMNGGNILTLKSLLGHSNINTTCIYIHISQNFNALEGIRYV